MPNLYFCDFPVGAPVNECVEFLFKKLNRQFTVKEAIKIIKNDDYTKRFHDISTSVKMVINRMNYNFISKNKNRSNSVLGLKNGRSVLDFEKQNICKQLYSDYGGKYTFIGKQIGVSKDTVRNFLNGVTYAQHI